ncbi:MAG: alanine racemase [Clostridia bacterium]|nr:alanine racemase [Clostridia bacterium]
MRIHQLETPAAIVDLDALDRNLKTMQEMLGPKGPKLRPHYKSFKCTAIAHYLAARGVDRFLTAKLSEAEDLIASGFEDVLIGNQVTDPQKIARLAYLAGCCKLTVCVDDAANIAALEAACALAETTLHCLVEFDIGMDRCGVHTEEEFIALAKQLDAAPHLVFEGIQAYAGNLAHEFDKEKRAAGSFAVEEKVRHLKATAEASGLTVPTVSGVSTGTVAFHTCETVYTEVQAGSFLFGDRSYRDVGTAFRQSLYLLTSVISTRPGTAVFDCGVKSLGMDQRAPYFAEYPDQAVEFSEEHSALYFAHDLCVGDRRRIVPGHCCTTVNLWDKLYLCRGGKVVACVPVTGRGKAQ